MTQSFEGTSRGPGGSDSTSSQDRNSASGGADFAGSSDGILSGQSGSRESSRNSSGSDSWMPQNFGGGQAGDVINSIRDFGRKNPTATLGGAVLAVLALAGYASSSGKRRQEQRYRGQWQTSDRSQYGDVDRSRREDFRGRRDGFSRDSFSGSEGRYTGASYSGRGHSYPGFRSVGRYGMNHPVGVTAGAALGALALSWFARGWGQNGQSSRQDRDWQGTDQSFTDQDFRTRGGTDWRNAQAAGSAADAETFSGSQTSSPRGGPAFGETATARQSFGSGRMGADAIEASGSSSDIEQGTSGSSFAEAQRRARSTSTGGL